VAVTDPLLLQLVAGHVKEALQFGRDRLRHFQHGQTLEPHEVLLLKDTLALLAYTDPSQAPMKYLVSDEHRRKVARIINAAILFHLKEQEDAPSGNGMSPSQAWCSDCWGE